MKLHEQVYKHLIDNKISVRKLANNIESSHTHILKFVKGEREISASLLLKLNECLNTDFKEPDTISNTSHDLHTPLI